VGLVGVEGGLTAISELDAGGSFPLRVEPAHLSQLGDGRSLVAGEKPERTTGLNRRQLSPVAGKEDLASGIACRADELIESEGSCQAGLVDDQQLPCP
jgi:hypothetical protein